MLKIEFSTGFKKDYRRLKRRKYDITVLDNTIAMLATGNPLPAKYRDHILLHDYAGCHECHIGPDWLLIYEIRQETLLLHLTRTGTHSDIFS